MTMMFEASENGGSVLFLRGELDMSTLPILEAALAPLVARGQPATLDLSELSFIDSMGVGVLVRASLRLSADKACLTLHSPQGIVLKTLTTVGLDAEPNIHIQRCSVRCRSTAEGPGT